ncbi:MAG: hypothetical protein GY820_22940 [Gammaproteobacteria bacterium]|nr:hypothetical protein [Gammaproteobacteria bacterium]
MPSSFSFIGQKKGGGARPKKGRKSPPAPPGAATEYKQFLCLCLSKKQCKQCKQLLACGLARRR